MTGTHGAADSAGQTFAGRALTGAGFDDDTGAADADLIAAMAAPQDERRLVAAVAGARLLVPIVAAPSEVDGSGPLTVEKSTDMAVVVLTAPDGQRALPAFSSLEAMAAWDPDARPSPVTSALAAQAAVSEQCEVMVLDLGSDGVCVLRPSMVWALAQQREWLPAYADPFVSEAVARAVQDEPDVEDVATEDGQDAGPGVLRVGLTVRAGLSTEEIQALATRVGERIATDGGTRARIDGLAFSLRAAQG